MSIQFKSSIRFEEKTIFLLDSSIWTQLKKNSKSSTRTTLFYALLIIFQNIIFERYDFHDKRKTQPSKRQ